MVEIPLEFIVVEPIQCSMEAFILLKPGAKSSENKVWVSLLSDE